MKSAAIAALVGSLICYPRLALWAGRAYPIWYLEALLLLGGFVLWAFVFAWHAKYAGQSAFEFRLAKGPCILVTMAGIMAALVLHELVDPLFRVNTPEDYPDNLQQWLAMVLFALGFNQLFLIFAPFDWSVRLLRKRWIAGLFTVLFGVFVLIVKTRSSPTEPAPSLFWLLVLIRGVGSLLAVWLYSRHGVVLVWWWGFLLQARHWLTLADGTH